jgi:DNA-binding LacI/PurR family transcriptional regulator
MPRPLRRLPLVEQTAAHLREGFQSGRWVGQLPGVLQLADELVVSKHLVRSALKILEGEGWIEDCGAGRRRRIVPPRDVTPVRRTLRIGILPDSPPAGDEVLFGIRHAIEAAGHTCVFSERSLLQTKDNLSTISRCVRAANADAWIVFAGPLVVLEWFAAQSFPVFAYGGRFHGLPMASTALRLAPGIESAVNRLVELGHRRITLLIETFLRRPTLIPSLESYLAALEAHGIPATDYHLPHFEDTAEGLESCLEGLFRVTPPTAVIVHHATYCAAVYSFLAHRGLRMPRDVSVISMFTDPILSKCLPPIDHFLSPREKYLARILRWVDGVAHGRVDQRQAFYEAVYVPGGTVGPVKK